jgi:long-chain acyl-CoA synthetase
MPRPLTVPDLLLQRLAATPERLAFRYPSSDGAEATLTWRETAERVRHIASGLQALGLRSEQCCALVSGTRIEWILADLGVLCAGGGTTTVYPSSPQEDCTYILADAGCVVAFVENAEQLAKLQASRASLPALLKVVLFEGSAADGDSWVMSLQELEALGRERERAEPGQFERTAQAVRPEHVATIIYTSGTTGKPKGVRLTHDGWVYQSEAAESVGLFSADDHQLLWLPLSHAMGKVLEVCALRVGFVTTVDGRVPQLMENLERLKPTFMGAPPRIFEKIYAKLVTAAEQNGGVQSVLVRWALRVAGRVARERREGRRASGLLRLELALADRLVFAKIRRRFGGRMRFMFSGSAPLPRELAEFFHVAGLLILEGYGLTETSAGAVLNRMDGFRFGSVGRPLAGTEIRIEPDGEILLKSRGVMQGYQNLPDETQAALTDDGWLRTGDIGELDEAGYLRVTDRKKDMIKTSTGLYVAPQKVEALVKAHCPYVGHVVVHGDERSYCSALIALDADAIKQWASTSGASTKTYAELARHPEVRALIEPAIAKVNARLTSHETIRKFALLSEELTIESGLLTPSMKLKRKAAEARFATTLDSLYRDPSVESPELGEQR